MLRSSCIRVRTCPSQKWSCHVSRSGKSLYPQLCPAAQSAHILQLQPHAHLSPSSHPWIPADGFPQQMAMDYAEGMQEELSCFVSCCLGQIPTLCQFLGASNCCSLWGTDVVSSVASVQPPDTSAEENSAHYMELEFRLSRQQHFFSYLTIAGRVNRNAGTWHKILSLCTEPRAALFTLQPPGLKPRSSSKNWLEKLLPGSVLTEEMAGLCRTGHASTRLLLYSGSSQAQLKLLENGIKSIFPNFFMLRDASCLSSETGHFKNRYYVPLNSTNHMGTDYFCP